MNNYRLPDGNREIAFSGALLAQSSSDDGRAQRWLDLNLYHTDTDRYVLHRVGRSVVYHAAGSTCTRQAQPQKVGDLDQERRDELMPCVRCAPPNIYSEDIDGDVQVLVEQDRSSVTVCERAPGLVESLYGVDDKGTRFLSRVAQRLLEEASKADAGIREAWNVQTV